MPKPLEPHLAHLGAEGEGGEGKVAAAARAGQRRIVTANMSTPPSRRYSAAIPCGRPPALLTPAPTHPTDIASDRTGPLAREFIYHMRGLSKTYPGNRKVLENINLS